MHPLARKVTEADPRAVARVCRLVDDAVGSWRAILKDLFPCTGRAWTIGVTGAPGAGKSTLADRLIAAYRRRSWRVAVVAIDPSSPFSGGAILGDRIRMQRHHDDPEVFIRSLATRGALGGLSRSAADVVRVLDAWGANVVLVETVGVGQDEIEVARAVDTTALVMAPGMGDEVQAAKAGVIECADVFVVNKADRDGAEAAVRDLELVIALGRTAGGEGVGPAGLAGHLAAASRAGAQPAAPEGAAGGAAPSLWQAQVVRCVATRGQGVEELTQALDAHRRWLEGTDAGRERRRERLSEAMRAQLRGELFEQAAQEMGAAIDAAVAAVARREIDPYTAAEQLVAKFRGAP